MIGEVTGDEHVVEVREVGARNIVEVSSDIHLGVADMTVEVRIDAAFAVSSS
jgi:hypothetical protein